MYNFSEITFPAATGNDVFKSLGVENKDFEGLLTKFMKAGKMGLVKSQTVAELISNQEFTNEEMKLIFLLAYDRAVDTIQRAGEKVFGNG